MSNDVKGDEMKEHPSISNNVEANMTSLVSFGSTGFWGPNCHSACLMALGLEFALFHNDTEMMDKFIAKFTTKTKHEGNMTDLTQSPQDLEQGDIFVIRKQPGKTLVHTFIYKGNNTFFQKDDDKPGPFYTSDIKGALEIWRAEEKDCGYTYEVVWLRARPSAARRNP